jgi:protein kinase-like protein
MSDPDKIGKYQIVERIGRGGMGTIFKAHDPILSRPVALKVIATEIDVTDEIRARFFREAQACARLSHPNIVTLYDMGEDGGRMFIVMELLDGVELRRLIADRAPLVLEEKLSIMTQVCDGLHYAHQQGIVHRDIKPGNIMRLRNGQVKILDFGIAQIEDIHETLTRSGLIMGTLRYMAPEQARGRADHRADIFSVGAVLYEFLGLQPPFNAKDALHLLEQLRTEDPTPLHLVDPTIPSELSDIVAGAMRKDPAERIPDLAQMGLQIEHVQRTLAEEAWRLNERIRAQRDQLRQLQAAVANRVGSSNEEAAARVDEPRHLAALQALEADLLARIQAAKGLLMRADVLAPAFERGGELLQAGQLTDAIAEFEGIIADMPEHALAADSLARARAQADAQRRGQLATRLVQDARAAVAAGEYTLCLEILKQAAEISPPAEAARDIASLQEMAEAAVATHKAALRVRQQAEDARARMAQARRTAQTRAEVQYAPALWQEAEAKSAGAEAAFARAAYAEAGRAFDTAIAAYGRFEEEGREARRQAHDAAERAREQATQGRQRAQVEGAPEYAREQWDAAEATFGEAQAAFDHDAMGRAAEVFNEALAAYGRAEEAVRARQHERPHANEDRSQVAEALERAAPRDGQELRHTAEPTGAMEGIPGTTAGGDAMPARSAGLEGAETRSRRFPGVVDDPSTLERGWRWAFWARGTVVVVGGLTAIAIVLSYLRSPHMPPGPYATPPATTSVPQPSASTSSGGAGTTADPLERPQPARETGARANRQPLEQSAGVGQAPAVKIQPDRPVLPPPGRAEERGAESRPAGGRRDAEQAGVQMASARREAEKAAAAFYAPNLLGTARAKENEGTEALQRSDYNSAIRLLAEARSDYQAAAQEARREADTERQIAPLKAGVEQARDTALARRRQALAAEAERLAMDLLRAAETRHAEADSLAARQSFAAAARAYDEAAERYTEAALRAQAAGAK